MVMVVMRVMRLIVVLCCDGEHACSYGYDGVVDVKILMRVACGCSAFYVCECVFGAGFVTVILSAPRTLRIGSAMVLMMFMTLL